MVMMTVMMMMMTVMKMMAMMVMMMVKLDLRNKLVPAELSKGAASPRKLQLNLDTAFIEGFEDQKSEPCSAQ